MNSKSARFLLVVACSAFHCVHGFSSFITFPANTVTNINSHSEPIQNPANGQISVPSNYYFNQNAVNTERIYGGKYAREAQFPYMAVVHRLIDDGTISQCGGTVISSRWVLTAGHCIAKAPHKFFVIFGVISKVGIGYNFNVGPGISMMTTEYVVHPHYIHTINDIGLLRMPQDIPFTKKIQPIRLAGFAEARNSFAGETAYVVGWGRDKQTSRGTKALKYAELPVIPHDECLRYWKVDERNICTASGPGGNACQGDSGGPLIVMHKGQPLQIGIVSYGDADCPSGKPGVFTRVSTYTSWIQSVTGLQY